MTNSEPKLTETLLWKFLMKSKMTAFRLDCVSFIDDSHSVLQ